MSADGFVVLNSDLEVIPGDGAEACRHRIDAIVGRVDEDYIHLGRELYVAFHKRYYIDWQFGSFDDAVAALWGISRERADRVRRVWTKFVKELNIGSAELAQIRYARAYKLLGVIDADNKDELLQRARSMSWASFNEHVDLLRGNSRAIEALKVSALSVEERESENSSISGRQPAQSQDESGPAAPEPERPTRMTFNLYPSQLEVLRAALAEVEREKAKAVVAPNEALAHIATEFLAQRMSKSDEPNANIRYYLRMFERHFGGKFVWFTNADAVRVVSEAIDRHPEYFSEGMTRDQDQEDRNDEHARNDQDDDSRSRSRARSGPDAADRG